jgi:Tfp pilus assembly protein PilV
MGLMLALLVSMLTLTAAIVAVAAMRNGVLAPDQTSDELSRRISQQRLHIAEATRAHPQHLMR